ncbi:MAG: hypothetical protein Q7R30_24745 [Acidobacteriota bacterium]|nr:hypothetical protein [Acidobacteriota bacterium]
MRRGPRPADLRPIVTFAYLTGWRIQSEIYRRYAIVSEGDLGVGVEKLGALATGTISGTKSRRGRVRRFAKA